MDPEMKSMVSELLTLTRDNNVLLRKLRRASIWGGIFRAIWWIVIIGSTVGAFYYFQPLFDNLLTTYQDLLGFSEGGNFDFQNLIKQAQSY